MIAATASSAYAEMSGTSKSLASFNKHIESGAQVLVISGSGLGATECERLGSESGIVSSGSLDDRGVARWVADSSTPLPVGTVTRGWLELVGASVPPSASGWVIGSELADTLGLQRGDLFGVQGGGPPDPVIVVLPSGPRTERVGGWALDLIAPIGSVRSCWLEADGVRTDDAEMAALSVFAGA